VSEPVEERLLAHEYDGIREYDNPTPGWWKGIFLISVVFAIGYWVWFHAGGPGKSAHAEYAEAKAQHEALRAAREAEESAGVNEQSLAALAADPAGAARGREVFLARCLACHTENGRGLVGPNLTDEFQIHGSTRIDIYETVKNGVPEKGMLAWGPVLAPEELMAVAAYAATLRGGNVPEGKAPEGVRVGPLAP
jgi:cytochrome c oxidase cbb3-type subunit 3